ncbi:MAG TPA: hypothetical protein DDW52_24440 [Planctomycetaceae bacterium]|nr:hypothetical protein [Planctomycetaceae bacterium]
MNLLLDERRSQETNSHVRESISEPETKRLRKGDWWFLESSTMPDNASTNSAEPDAEESTTPRSAVAPKTVRPVSKDVGIVTLDGDRKVLLQQWECVVLERQHDVVCCELYDITDESNPVEYAEVLLSEFNTWDLPLLVEGAVFYWSLGHFRRQTGQVKRFTEFRLRRMPDLGKAKRNEITRKVKNLSGLLLEK